MDSIRERILKLADKKMKKFNSGIIPNSLPILGIKNDEIRLIAKDICKNDVLSFLDNYEFIYYEEQLLYAFVLGTAKLPYDVKFKYLDKFIPTITDWAVHDGLVSSLKCVKKNKEEYLKFILKYVNSKKEFEVRFVAIMLMDYYLDDDHINLVYNVIFKLYLEDYYVKMGVAWLIATMAINYKDYVLKVFEKDDFDRWTINKSISKIRESYRIDKDFKELVLKYKKMLNKGVLL